jgi:hypothetical protein
VSVFNGAYHIAPKKQKLIEEEKKLVEKRKKEIANFLERFNLLTTADDILVGLFSEAEKSIHSKDSRMKEWESIGARFLKSSKLNAKEATKNDGHA